MYKCPRCGLRYVGGQFRGDVHPTQRCGIHGVLCVYVPDKEPVATILTCSITGCEKHPAQTVKIMGRWESVCEDHVQPGWTMQDSMNHMVETLQGRRA